MITFLNKKQLAFILDINQEDARAKMCHAWAKSKKETQKAEWSKLKKHKIEDNYPVAISIEVLATELNIPNLQEMVNEIHDNYLKRQATKKFILFDFPEKELKTKRKDEVHIPPGLKSLMPDEIIQEIKTQWVKRYGIESV